MPDTKRTLDAETPILPAAPGETQVTPAAPKRVSRAPALDRLGRYEIRAELGRGGMGVVYRGHDPGLDRPVALKVLSPMVSEDPDFRARFQREARSLGRIEHANVVKVHDVGEDGGIPFLAMELVEGESVDAIVKQRGKSELTWALGILRQAALGLQAAYAQGIIHRDVKPANLMVGVQGQLKILDFGLALMPDAERRTATDVIMGTPEYMSPEQGRGQKPDHRADMYALGATMYFMLAGAPPFTAPTSLATIQKQIHDSPPPLEDVRTDIPEPVRLLVERLLAKDPAARPPDYASLIEELDQAAAVRDQPWPGRFARWLLATLWRPGRYLTAQRVNVRARTTLPHVTRLALATGLAGAAVAHDPALFPELCVRTLLALGMGSLAALGLSRALGASTTLRKHWVTEVAAASYLPLFVMAPAGDAWALFATIALVRGRWAALGEAGVTAWVPRLLVLAGSSFAVLLAIHAKS